MKQELGTIERWQPDQFYWAVLEIPGWKPCRGTSILPPGLAAQVAEELPLDATALHAVIAPAGGSRVLVCAAARESLAALGPRVLRLLPDSLPACLAESMVDPASINFLVGEFEPAPIRRARTRHHLLVAAATLTVAVLVSVGMLRRAERWHEAELAARAAIVAVVDAAAVPRTADDMEPATAILAESIRLQRLADAATKIKPPSDVAPTLAGFLAAWPTDVPSKPQSISLGTSSVSLAVTLDQDPSQFLTAFTPPPGWIMDEPRINRAGSVTRVNLQLRADGSKGDKP